MEVTDTVVTAVALGLNVSAALVAVTVHVPDAADNRTAPPRVHGPDVTAYVTAPVPVPPDVLSSEKLLTRNVTGAALVVNVVEGA